MIWTFRYEAVRGDSHTFDTQNASIELLWNAIIGEAYGSSDQPLVQRASQPSVSRWGKPKAKQNSVYACGSLDTTVIVSGRPDR